LGTLKYFQQWGPAFAKTLSEISIKFDRDFLDTYQKKGYTVVDLACDPESYKPENLYSDGLHPVDSGYRIIAAKLSQYLSAQPPVYPTTCPAVPAQNTGF
jgi:lysophospholipase L1-like esterase